MRVTSKGQVTIPRDLRNMFGILPDSEVVFGIEGGKITLAAKDADAAKDDRERLNRFLKTLDRLEGTGDQSLDAHAVMSITRDR